MTPGEQQPLDLEALASPGPTRSTAVRAIAARLRLDLSVCRDRSHAIAARAVDDVVLGLRAQADLDTGAA